MSELKVNKISPRSGTDVTLGDSGDTFTIPAGATITNNGTANGFDTDTNDKVKVSSNDTTAGFLNGKLVAGTGISLTEGSDGGDETLTIASTVTAPITGTANGADNRVATYSAASTLNGEANLTFDGSTLALTGNMTVSGTVDGQDVAAVATTASAALPKAGGTMTGNLVLGDNVKALFGTGNDLEIYHNGSHSIIEDVGTGKLEIRSNGTGVDIQKENAEFMARFITDGAVELYHDSSKKLETTASGVAITGDVDLGDNEKVTFGNGEDLIIFHDATDSIIKEQGGGDLIIRGQATIKIQNEDGSETYANFKHNDSVELFTNGTKVFQTISDGVEILGHCRPSASNTYDLGTSSLVWRNIYTSDLNMSNEGLDKGNDVDGTKGSWTFQEGADDLFLLNNKNGKKYKFKLEECK